MPGTFFRLFRLHFQICAEGDVQNLVEGLKWQSGYANWFFATLQQCFLIPVSALDPEFTDRDDPELNLQL
ncbi:MAG: hypothetical protein HY525_08665 [Betaproteobacteria bacterium]|nr:hypothetical protein [Betaproteobacteria bacterium]